jgi:hypothetical protein
MKKFLFTLAALMMAGSAFAADYFYLEDFEVPASALGASGTAGRINVNVKAHFDNYVSAWQVWFTVPEGLTIQGHRAGTDLTLAGHDDFGDPKTFTPNLKVSPDKLSVIVACDEADYSEDGDYYGCMKWTPGDYDQMWIVVFNAAADFAGGEVTVLTEPACGQDVRPEVTPTDGQTTTTEPIEVTVEGAGGPEDFVGTADVTFDGNVATISYTSNDPNATVEVTMNGNPLTVTFVDGVATWEAPTAAEQTEPGDYSYTVAIKVTPDGENFVGEPVQDSDTYAYTVEKTATPVITIIHKDGSHAFFTVEGDGDVVVTVNGQPATPAVYNGVPCYVVYAVEGQPVTYDVVATAQENGKLISDEATEAIAFAAWDGVDELVNGKAVAGVRYFNMAGQEMQQANGVTIVVTTYTDGTTSAVKVMK